MSFFRDNLKPFFKKRALRFIESIKETDNIHSFLFEKEDDFVWHAGQYGLFNIIHKSVKNGTRPFSISSAPSESVIRITTRVGQQPSAFKQALLELTPGMTVMMRGPVGPFYLKDEQPTLLIAGGIGITPFRSMLKQLELSANKRERRAPIHLLYIDGEGNHLFKDELAKISQLQAIHLALLDAREALYEEINTFSAQHSDNGKYYIAGPQSMVDDLYRTLQTNRISKKNILKDAFFGY